MSTGEFCVICGEEAKFVIAGPPICSKAHEIIVRRSRDKYVKKSLESKLHPIKIDERRISAGFR